MVQSHGLLRDAAMNEDVSSKKDHFETFRMITHTEDK